jgi:predicted kinase
LQHVAGSQRYPLADLIVASATECIIFVGLQAAGKTTFYREHFSSTHVLVSKDLWPTARRRDERQLRAIDEALAASRSVVVDNTNLTINDRRPIIALARSRGARVIGYFFEVSTRAAVARNAGREGRAKVPNVAIFASAKRLQPPALSEGFDELFRVTLTPEGTAVRSHSPIT